MSGRGRNRGAQRNRNRNFGSVAQETATSLPADSPVLEIFRKAAMHLNDRQDRHERLIKLSRDITIESKRIIFLLHSAVTKKSVSNVVQEANERLNKLVEGPIKSIGLDLDNSPAYLHSKAVTFGFQEFIEAKTLCSLMDKRSIITHKEVQNEFNHIVNDEDNERNVTTLLPHVDYMLGVADLTGELMRRAINSIASGDTEECFHACQVVRDLYTGFLGLFCAGKELARKLNTTRANVAKVEGAVYSLKVRGGETPCTLLPLVAPLTVEWDVATNHSDDEGYY